MGKRGPRKESEKMKLLKGTFRGDRDSHEPRPAPIRPECPGWLPAEAVKEWDSLAPALERLGLLTSIDGDQFAFYCLFTARARQAEKLINDMGLLVKSARGDGQMVKNPAVQIARDYGAAASKMADKFGLNPSSRAGLGITQADEGVLNKFIRDREYDEMESLLTKPEDCRGYDDD